MGPRLRTYTGAITTQLSTAAGCVEAVHSATGLRINESERSFRLRTRFCADGARERAWQLAGRNERGEAQLTGALSVTHDAASRCITRNGTLSGSINGRAFTRVEQARVRCVALPTSNGLTDARSLRDARGSVLLTRGETTVTWTPSDPSISDNQTQWGDIVISGEI